MAGKTGTAQVYKHSAGIDSDRLPKHERDHAWFGAFAPAEEPRLVVVVLNEHGGHGGSGAAPIAMEVLRGWFNEVEPKLGIITGFQDLLHDLEALRRIDLGDLPPAQSVRPKD